MFSYKESGSVLFAFIIVLMILMGLLLTLLHEVSLDQRMSFLQYQQSLAMTLAKQALKQSVHQINQQDYHCIMPYYPTSKINQTSDQFWQSLCVSDHSNYFLNRLSDDSCTFLNEHRGVQYWRVLIRTTVGQATLFTSSIIASNKNFQTACIDSPVYLTQQVQSFLEL